MGKLVIGVLALQGDFEKHVEVLKKIDCFPVKIKKPLDLDECDALIIPGGESTAMTCQLRFSGLEAKIAAFAKGKPVWGTCAGIILMSQKTSSPNVLTFNLLDIAVSRNAYGRQTESFSTLIKLKLNEKEQLFKAIFIRAPKIIEWKSDNIKVLAEYEGAPVLVRQGMCLGSTFHPELTEDSSIHDYFMKMATENRMKSNKE